MPERSLSKQREPSVTRATSRTTGTREGETREAGTGTPSSATTEPLLVPCPFFFLVSPFAFSLYLLAFRLSPLAFSLWRERHVRPNPNRPPRPHPGTHQRLQGRSPARQDQPGRGRLQGRVG